MTSRSLDHNLNVAAQAFSAGRRPEGRRVLEEVLGLDPANPTALNMLGMDAMTQGDAARAAQLFEAAHASAPQALAVLINLAGAYRSLQQDGHEERALRAALAIDQRNLAALIRIAELHERRGDDHEATLRWSGVVSLASQVPDPSPALAERLEHARAYVSAQTRELKASIERDLEVPLARASSRDRRRARAAAAVMLGERAVYSNQCEGMHYPFLPADEFFDVELLPWLAELEAATPVIKAEWEAIRHAHAERLKPYVAMAPGTPESKWSILDGKADWSALHLWNEGVRDDAVCALAPNTAALVERLPLCRLPNRAPTVFFSLLKANSHIPAHTGVTNTRAIVHLPLVVPQGCTFRVGGETRPWVEGQAFAFDDTIDHEAWNASEEDRAVLILDCWNPHLSSDEQDMIVRMYHVADQAKNRSSAATAGSGN